jgi:hypothetical protein
MALLTLAMATAMPVAAETLAADAARKVTQDRTWRQKQPSGPAFNYWTWKADGTVCLRLEDKRGKCADTGSWKLEGGRLCYELTWWAKSYGMNAGCFRIARAGEGRLEALQDNGLSLFSFWLED